MDVVEANRRKKMTSESGTNFLGRHSSRLLTIVLYASIVIIYDKPDVDALKTPAFSSFPKISQGRDRTQQHFTVTKREKEVAPLGALKFFNTERKRSSGVAVKEMKHQFSQYVKEKTNVLPMPRMMDRNMTDVEMSAMSAFGLAVSLGVIYTLALSNEQPFGIPDATSVSENVEVLGDVAERLIDATVPQSAPQALSVALGEGIAGVIGAVVTVVVSLLLKLRNQGIAVRQDLRGFLTNNRQEVLTEAVADGDYFLTRAAALPLFEAAGLPPFAATLTSVILASVPYELVKLGSQRREAMFKEEAMMNELLRELQEEKGRRRRWSLENLNAAISPKNIAPLSRDPGSLIQVNKGAIIDFPEVFADITKWLEYDVLKNDLGGTISLNGHFLAPNIDGAIFGFVAALSSQLYTDLIYRYTDYGTLEKKEESRNRSLGGWGRLYASKGLNAALLFGVYETVKGPVTSFLFNIGSGGVEGCLGSQDYNLCMDTYMLNNPPEASSEAQFRSLATALVSLLLRFQSADSADKVEFLRSLLVQLYSFIQQIFSTSLYA